MSRRRLGTTVPWALATLALAATLAHPLRAQADSDSVAAPVVRRNVAKLPFEDGAIVVDAHSDGAIVVGAAHDDSTIAIALPGPAVREWADSAARILAKRIRNARTPRTYRALVTSPQTGEGISFTRQVSGKTSEYRLFFANAHYGGFPIEISPDEAELFVRVLHKAVRVARAMEKQAGAHAP
ncbi:MAG: hypothetical protein IRY91_16205 [Gemmatimonadaceae bacterium]|nr:hypothetical protein [Gemmatimonadaceae bacterium]